MADGALVDIFTFHQARRAKCTMSSWIKLVCTPKEESTVGILDGS